MKLLACLLPVVLASLALAGETVLQDDFTGPRRFIDVSMVTPWGANREPRSALEVVKRADSAGLSYTAVKMTDDALSHSRWDGDLRAATCFDYTFPSIRRAATTIRLEFDALWDAYDEQNWGEGNRLLVTLMHEYPKGGPRQGDLARTAPADGHPFGRPAYHFRIRNTRKSLGAMMNYAGGSDEELGAFERYNDKNGGVWWLPGFIASNKKGASPGDEVSYEGRKDPYPKTPTQKTGKAIASTEHWTHITWVLQPERLELYHRRSQNAVVEDKLVFFMEIPKTEGRTAEGLIRRIAEAHGLSDAGALRQLPDLYHWFDQVCAIRFYFRGNKTYLANIRLTTTEQ